MKDTLFKWWDFVAPIFNKLLNFFGNGNKNVHLSIDDRRAGEIDNSNRQTDIKQNFQFSFTGVENTGDAANLFGQKAADLTAVKNGAI